MSLEEQATAEPGADAGDRQEQERDYETEARALGWRPPEEFPGDPKKCVDAKTFLERGEVMLPLVKKALEKERREFAEFRKETRRALKHMGAAEQRGYERAMADLQTRHDEAVEAGDVQAARKVVKEMADMPKPEPVVADEDEQPDPAQLRKELNEWMEENDWYALDDDKRKYADLQATLMGPAVEWEGGNKAYLTELARRVEKKFSTVEKKPSPTNGGGNRESGKKGGRTLSDLPPEARAQAIKWDKQGIVKTEDYLKTYQWD